MPEALQILEFANALAIGGTERQIVNLVRGVDRSRFRVHVGTLASVGQLMGELEAAGAPITEYRVRHLYGPGAMAQQLRLVRYLVRERIQLIHTHGFYANAFALPPAWLARTPVRIASIRDDGSVWTPAQRSVERQACRLADCTVVNADVIRRRLVAEGFQPQRIAVIPNGVDVERFREPQRASELRAELGLPQDAPVVGVLARLARCKGIEVFLDAARLLLERFPQARFLIVGDEEKFEDGRVREGGSYRRALEERAAQLGLERHVVFTGFRLDVPAVLAAFTVSVLPSITGEGLPNCVLESMAAGLPVVATYSGGTSEAVDDGHTGLLVAPSDAGALARAIGTLLADPVLCKRFGAEGRRRAAEDFSLQRMARDMQRLYTQLLEQRRGATARGLQPSVE